MNLSMCHNYSTPRNKLKKTILLVSEVDLSINHMYNKLESGYKLNNTLMVSDLVVI